MIANTNAIKNFSNLIIFLVNINAYINYFSIIIYQGFTFYI